MAEQCVFTMIDGARWMAVHQSDSLHIAEHAKTKALLMTGRLDIINLNPRWHGGKGGEVVDDARERVITQIPCTPEQGRELLRTRRGRAPFIRLKPRRFPWQPRFRTEQFDG